MLPRLRDCDRSLCSFLASSSLLAEVLAFSAAGAVAAAVAAPASRDFLGSLDLERIGVVAMTAGLAKAALAGDHWRDSIALRKKPKTYSIPRHSSCSSHVQ
jgi:hypothetical protein